MLIKYNNASVIRLQFNSFKTQELLFVKFYSKLNEKIRKKIRLENINEMEMDIVKEETAISWFKCCLGEKMELRLNKERRVV